MQRKSRIGWSLLMAEMVLGVAGVFAATPAAVAGSPWTSVMYGADGGLLGARGHDAGKTPLRIDLEKKSTSAGLLTVTRYGRGGDEVTIERSYEAPETLRVDYAVRGLRFGLAAHRIEAESEFLIVYHLADGQVFSVWAGADGKILSGDVKGLSQALREQAAIPELAHRYEEDRRPLRRHMPAAGDEILLTPGRNGCDLDRSEYCSVECTWECTNAMCEMCVAACRAGHRIVCGE